MKMPNRDLLVLVKDEFRSHEYMEFELEQLNMLLASYETMDCFCIAHEIFDLNRFKTIIGRKELRRLGRQRSMKPFVFICNKN